MFEQLWQILFLNLLLACRNLLLGLYLESRDFFVEMDLDSWILAAECIKPKLFLTDSGFLSVFVAHK